MRRLGLTGNRRVRVVSSYCGFGVSRTALAFQYCHPTPSCLDRPQQALAGRLMRSSASSSRGVLKWLTQEHRTSTPIGIALVLRLRMRSIEQSKCHRIRLQALLDMEALGKWEWIVPPKISSAHV